MRRRLHIKKDGLNPLHFLRSSLHLVCMLQGFLDGIGPMAALPRWAARLGVKVPIIVELLYISAVHETWHPAPAGNLWQSAVCTGTHLSLEISRF